MEKIDLILWFMGAGFSITLTFLLLLWKNISEKIEKIDVDIKDIRNEVKELRTSINRMEGAFYNKDCCILKGNEDLKKAE